MGTIKTRGIAEREVPADTTTFTIRFKTRDIKEDKAITKCTEICEGFLKDIMGMGLKLDDIELSEDRLSTGSYDDKTMRLCEKSIKFKTPCSPKFNSMISRIIAKGKYEVDLSKDDCVKKDAQIREQLLVEAIQDSRRKAELIASADGRRIIDIDSVCDNRYADYWEDEDLMEARCGNVTGILLDDDNSLLSNLAAPKVTIQETINISWSVG